MIEEEKNPFHLILKETFVVDDLTNQFLQVDTEY